MTKNEKNLILVNNLVEHFEEEGMSPENIFVVAAIAIGADDILIYEGTDLSPVFTVEGTMCKIVCTFVHKGLLFKIEVEDLLNGKVQTKLSKSGSKLLEDEQFFKCMISIPEDLN